jgi:hypothetical protein
MLTCKRFLNIGREIFDPWSVKEESIRIQEVLSGRDRKSIFGLLRFKKIDPVVLGLHCCSVDACVALDCIVQASFSPDFGKKVLSPMIDKAVEKGCARVLDYLWSLPFVNPPQPYHLSQAISAYDTDVVRIVLRHYEDALDSDWSSEYAHSMRSIIDGQSSWLRRNLAILLYELGGTIDAVDLPGESSDEDSSDSDSTETNASESSGSDDDITFATLRKDYCRILPSIKATIGSKIQLVFEHLGPQQTREADRIEYIHQYIDSIIDMLRLLNRENGCYNKF